MRTTHSDCNKKYSKKHCGLNIFCKKTFRQVGKRHGILGDLLFFLHCVMIVTVLSAILGEDVGAYDAVSTRHDDMICK